MKTSLKRTLSLSMILVSTSVLATNYQSFYGINYSNPAELTETVKDFLILYGDDLLIPNRTFTGTVTAFNTKHQEVISTGTTNSLSNTLNLPYGRIAKRIFSQWVIDVDVTKPFYSLVTWPTTGVTRYAATELKSNATDIAPTLAYQFTGKLADLSVGAGLDILNYPYDLQRMNPSLATPTMPYGAGPDIFVSEHLNGWDTGWHAGVYYHLFKPTFVGLSYFSGFNVKENGTSIFGYFPVNNNLHAAIALPETTNFKIKQILSEQWSTSLGIHYTQWHCFQTLFLQDVAGPVRNVLFTPHYSDTWREDLSVHYTASPQWSFDGAVAHDVTPTNNVDRSLYAPDGDTIQLYAAAEYKFTQSTAVRVDYTHTFFNNIPINNHVTPGAISEGTVSQYTNLVGFRVTYSV